MEVHLISGTRPEAIKLAPLAPALRTRGLHPVHLATGQHPTMVHQALGAFGTAPDVALTIDRGNGGQADLTAALIRALSDYLRERRPAAVVVQGDTTSALAGALSAFWAQIPVVHLEAGLRSHDLASPFPEEGNRKLIGQIARMHLPPTDSARRNLEAEGCTGPNVVVTGNTVVDAVLAIAQRDRAFSEASLEPVLDRARDGSSRLLLVTVHRRESWGAPLDDVLRAVRTILHTHADVEVVLPAHPNPAVRAQVVRALGSEPRAHVTDPLAYPDLVAVLASATLVISDSGGIQEEAPTFGVPVLVAREVTERLEAVEAGCAMLLGTDADLIRGTASRLLDDDDARRAMTSRGNPFGDGHAAARAAAAIAWLLGRTKSRPAPFVPRSPAQAVPTQKEMSR